jgi:hypothetical protein
VNRIVALAGVATLVAFGGCYRTRYELTPPTPSTASGVYVNHFHFSLINIFEISKPVDLVRACGGKPVAYIYEHTGVVAGIANAFLSHVFQVLHMKNATVYCAFLPTPPPVTTAPPMTAPTP